MKVENYKTNFNLLHCQQPDHQAGPGLFVRFEPLNLDLIDVIRFSDLDQTDITYQSVSRPSVPASRGTGRE